MPAPLPLAAAHMQLALRRCAYPMVVMKLDVKLSSAKRSSRQLLPTPAAAGRHGGAVRRQQEAAHECGYGEQCSSTHRCRR